MKTEKDLIQHFPWQRLILTGISMLSLIGMGRLYVDWLYYFATLNPAETSGGTAITALSAGMGVLFVCMAAINIWFITGSVKTVESMFRFNAATMAQTSLQSMAQQVNEHREEHITEEHIEHVITEGDPGAPERRPFHPDESHEEPQ